MKPSSVQRFVERAESFCRFMEEASSLALPDRLRRAQEELLALYQAALDLPDVEPGEEEEGATASVTDWGDHAIDALRALHRAVWR